MYRRRANLDPGAAKTVFRAVQQTRYKTRFLSTNLRCYEIAVLTIIYIRHVHIIYYDRYIINCSIIILPIAAMDAPATRVFFPFPAIRHECVFCAFHTKVGNRFL